MKDEEGGGMPAMLHVCAVGECNAFGVETP